MYNRIIQLMIVVFLSLIPTTYSFSSAEKTDKESFYSQLASAQNSLTALQNKDVANLTVQECNEFIIGFKNCLGLAHKLQQHRDAEWNALAQDKKQPQIVKALAASSKGKAATQFTLFLMSMFGDSFKQCKARTVMLSKKPQI